MQHVPLFGPFDQGGGRGEIAADQAGRDADPSAAEGGGHADGREESRDADERRQLRKDREGDRYAALERVPLGVGFARSPVGRREAGAEDIGHCCSEEEGGSGHV